MDYNLPGFTWFWLLTPSLAIVLLSLLRLILNRGGDS